MANTSRIAAVLKEAVDFGRRARNRRCGCNERRPDFRGRLRQTVAPLRRADDGGHGRLDRFHDESDHRRLRHATSRTRQAVARCADQDHTPRTRESDGARRLRHRRQLRRRGPHAATSRSGTSSPTPPAALTTSGAPTSRATWRRPERPRSSPARTPRSPRRCSSTPARNGNTESASTSPARRWKK